MKSLKSKLIFFAIVIFIINFLVFLFTKSVVCMTICISYCVAGAIFCAYMLAKTFDEKY